MKQLRQAPKTSERLRFLVVTLVLTLLYLGLQQLEMGTVDLASRAGLLDRGGEARWLEEARRLTAQSAGAEARLPATHRVDAWRLGYLLGYSSEWLGSFTFSATGRQEQARALAEPMLIRANTIAGNLGVGPVAVLPVHTAAEFGNLTARVEADELGIAARMEKQLSGRDRHLYLLGMHHGMFVAALEAGADDGPLPLPPTALIARHATLAGVSANLWTATARVATGTTRSEIIARQRAGITALEGGLTPGMP